MATEQTADEVKAEFVASFPPGAGELAYELWRSLAHVHMNWKDYRDLYGTSQETVDVLNWAAPMFFGLLDATLRHQVILAITRITDPPRSVGHDNASLSRLLEMLAPAADAKLLADWRSKLAGLQAYCEPLRSLRNRLLAHDDLATVLRYHPDPLPGTSREYLEGALERLRDLMGSIEQTYRGSHTSHQFVIYNRGAEDLVFVLKHARQHEDCCDH